MTIYLSDPAIDVLQRRWNERVADNGFVFPSHGITGHITEPKFAWSEILTRAKIGNLRVHDLRRTYGSWLAAGGASLPMIGKALGHKSTQTTAIYSRLSLDPLKSPIETAAAAMMGAAAASKKTAKRQKATA